MITDPIRACEALIGQTIEGISIDDEEGIAIITCNNGRIEIDFEESEIYIDVEERN